MNAAEIVEREPASDSGPMVLPLLAEGIREARKTPIAHARAEIGSLDNRGANAFGIRLPVDWDNLR